MKTEKIFIQPLCNDVLNAIENEFINEKLIRPVSKSTTISEEAVEEITILKMKI